MRWAELPRMSALSVHGSSMSERRGLQGTRGEGRGKYTMSASLQRDEERKARWKESGAGSTSLYS